MTIFGHSYITLPEGKDKRLPENNSKTTILVVSGEKVTGEDRELLDKIISSVNLNPENDITLIDDVDQMQVHTYLRDGHTEKILTFGLVPAQVGLQLRDERYQQFVLHDTKIVMADSLAEIAQMQDNKRKLWQIMKTVFQK